MLCGQSLARFRAAGAASCTFRASKRVNTDEACPPSFYQCLRRKPAMSQIPIGGRIHGRSAHSAMSISQASFLLKSPVLDRKATSVLTSWKEISDYVGKGVRTVQRWESKFGFPIRRVKPGRKSAVLAIPAEIDAWIQAQQFPDGRLDSVESERATLFRTLRELRRENRQLRSENKDLRTENLEFQRELAIERARVSGLKIA
jgi:cell division protein FtsB